MATIGNGLTETQVRGRDHPIADKLEDSQLVPNWKRLAFSLLSMVAASAAFAGLSLLLPGTSKASIELFLVATLVVSCVSLPGWFVALPLILLINNISGWRFWMYLGIGSSIGPVITYVGTIAPFLHSYKGHYSQAPTVIVMLGMSAVISCLATASYLLLLRGAQFRTIQRSRQTTSL